MMQQCISQYWTRVSSESSKPAYGLELDDWRLIQAWWRMFASKNRLMAYCLIRTKSLSERCWLIITSSFISHLKDQRAYLWYCNIIGLYDMEFRDKWASFEKYYPIFWQVRYTELLFYDAFHELRILSYIFGRYTGNTHSPVTLQSLISKSQNMCLWIRKVKIVIFCIIYFFFIISLVFIIWNHFCIWQTCFMLSTNDMICCEFLIKGCNYIAVICRVPHRRCLRRHD